MGKRKAPIRSKSTVSKRSALSDDTPVILDPLSAFTQNKLSLKDEDTKFSNYFTKNPIESDTFSSDILGSNVLMNTSTLNGQIELPLNTPDIPMESTVDIDEAALHADDLLKLKTVDPEFYKFLLENDKELLSFGQSEDINESSDIIDQEKEDLTLINQEISQSSTKLLTAERFEIILDSVENSDSYRGLVLLLQAFRTAVTEVSRQQKQESDINSIERDLLKKKNVHTKKELHRGKTTPRRKEPKLLFSLSHAHHLPLNQNDVEETTRFAYYICESVINKLGLVLNKRCHIETNKSIKVPPKSQQSNVDNITTIVLPTKSMLNGRTIVLLNHFWTDLALLLTHCYVAHSVASQFLGRILVQIASPLLLRWLTPARDYIITKVIESIIRLLLEARRKTHANHMDSPLAAFLILRNISSLFGQKRFHIALSSFQPKATDIKSHLDDQAQKMQQKLLTTCYRHFTQLVTKVGFSWKAISGYEFIITCFIQLFSEADPSVVYRIVFLAIRQLALIVRNVAIARSHGKSGKKKSAGAIQAEKIGIKKIEQTSRQLYNWSFIYASRLLILTCNRLKSSLFPLIYPLSSIFTCIIKMNLQNLTYSPFVIECLRLQCEIMSSLGVFVPLGSHLISIGQQLIALQERVTVADFRKLKTPTKGLKKKKTLRNPTHVGAPQFKSVHIHKPSTRDSVVKPIDTYTVIRISDLQLGVSQVAEQLVQRWTDVCVDHLGTLSRHPSFPEVVAPLTFNLKQLAKCRSDTSRRELKKILSLCNTSSAEVRQKRFNIDPKTAASSEGKLLIFNENEISLAKHRLTTIAARAEYFALRVKEGKGIEAPGLKPINNGCSDNASDIDAAIESEEDLMSDYEDTAMQSISVAHRVESDNCSKEDTSHVLDDTVEDFEWSSSDEENESEINNLSDNDSEED